MCRVYCVLKTQHSGLLKSLQPVKFLLQSSSSCRMSTFLRPEQVTTAHFLIVAFVFLIAIFVLGNYSFFPSFVADHGLISFVLRRLRDKSFMTMQHIKLLYFTLAIKKSVLSPQKMEKSGKATVLNALSLYISRIICTSCRSEITKLLGNFYFLLASSITICEAAISLLHFCLPSIHCCTYTRCFIVRP